MGIEENIIEAITSLHDSTGVVQDGIGLRVRVSRSTSDVTSILFEPVLHLPFQGSKRIVVGSRTIDYGAGDVAILAAHLPALVEVTAATVDKPYVALEIPFDRRALLALVSEMPPQDGAGMDTDPVSVSRVPDTVLEPLLRLLHLAPDPAAAAVLASGVRREIYYRLLASPLGDRIRELLHAESVLARIDEATTWMQDHFAEPVRIEELAFRAHMSVSTFHRRFRQITGTSPGAYHKAVRLHEARRQIVEHVGTLTQIATAVGFVSPAQFSRDYKRIFGQAPSRDMASLVRRASP